MDIRALGTLDAPPSVLSLESMGASMCINGDAVQVFLKQCKFVVRELRIEADSISKDDLECIFYDLSVNYKIERLSLTVRKGMNTGHVWDNVCTWLANSTSIRLFDIYYPFRQTSAKQLGDAVAKNHSLEILRINIPFDDWQVIEGDVCITNGLGHVLDGVNANGRIRHVSLIGHLSNLACAEMCEFVRRDASLVELTLTEMLLPHTYKLLCEALWRNTTLLKIDLPIRVDLKTDDIPHMVARNKEIHTRNLAAFNLLQTLMITNKIPRIPKHLLMLVKHNTAK